MTNADPTLKRPRAPGGRKLPTRKPNGDPIFFDNPSSSIRDELQKAVRNRFMFVLILFYSLYTSAAFHFCLFMFVRFPHLTVSNLYLIGYEDGESQALRVQSGLDWEESWCSRGASKMVLVCFI